ncbi:Dyp-type peroxidase [Actinophytocola oryzae]|uniref:Dyp-type peroxidase family n=1 Tax=Actinophytocola oryzae TaxID=502181 RepID=A0A4R7W1U3_9PSEU|nr:Dyp-type peroxidase [Actinophytocola oryzae]TDV56392.1 Dyp-type peroxidase family [Actinophytocola oryzae]
MTDSLVRQGLESGPAGGPSTVAAADERNHDIWSHVQRGLVYPAPYALFATFWAAPEGSPLTLDVLRRVTAQVRHRIHDEFGSSHTTAVAGVGFRRWAQWCAEEDRPLPMGMRVSFPASQDDPVVSNVFERSAGTFADSAGDLWFHIKSDCPTHCRAVFEYLAELLGECVDPARTAAQEAATRSERPDKRGGKVLGCRFSENLNNPTDPVTVRRSAVVGGEDPDHLGASFVLAQRFVINWARVLDLSAQGIEDMVGRTDEDVLIPSREDRSHIKRSRVQDDLGNTTPVLRLSLPFGQSAAVHDEVLREKGASVRDEEGFYFAAYSRSTPVLEKIMDRQIGEQPGFIADRLLMNVHADVGGFFYIPSQDELGMDPLEIGALADTDWRRFPGVDWSRLDRHFDQRSANGYMYYNHRDYLYRMSTMTGEDREKYLPPSRRVLGLLATAFSRWEDNWYLDRTQQELHHLEYYLRDRFGETEAARIMALPVVERMGWAVRIGLGDVFAGHDYGFRGRRRDCAGNWVTGADTYRMAPLELIVGAMPNLSLGEGRYVIDYVRDDEQLPNFFSGLSSASGVGHVVPGFQRALEVGIGGLVANVRTKLDEHGDDEQKASFYRGVLLALDGVSAHCRSYAELARELLDGPDPAGRENLLAIADRMDRLATEPPATMLEAAQLLFTLHSCLHLVGEPTAVGRLDQMLYPFYRADVDAGRLDRDRAQEIIDCFWIKLGEKVQPNRMFLDDHQPWGNLAMGGIAGNYPQGGSNNQWVQQVTVGGTVADDRPGAGTPAYNEVTMLCLRAARRLPLNAPCLSLRTRQDMPAEFAEEAALALLSGGAHPILVNDEKIIPGLLASGDNVGAGTSPTASTPVADKAGAAWHSTVDLVAARDYACDGCYEPQFTGRNWFTLGMVITLQALEAALNRGKSWATAGPMYFRGQKVSFMSEAPREITSYERVEELFFQHFRWMFARQTDQMLGVFGQMSAVCPSPLLSCFVDDCVDKGLDFYAGGARYNVAGPCFTALANTINSLWAIRHMVFTRETAVTSLPELVEALICDWGESMSEPFAPTLAGPARTAARADRFRRLRKVAMDLPKYGRGHREIDEFGDALVARVARTAVEVYTEPAEPTARKMVALAERCGTAEHPFGLQIQPGVGTFENYLEFGAMCGASADGRLGGQPMASDLSPSPSCADQPVGNETTPFLATLDGFSGPGSAAMWNAAPTEYNVREDFPAPALVEVIRAFAAGRGSNILTITCADPDTFSGACEDPEKYDLLRVRMGGWAEFFVAMFPDHQQQHRRRPVSVPDAPTG